MLATIALGTLVTIIGVVLLANPKCLVGATFLAVLFVRTVSHLTGVESVDNLDDAMVVLCLFRALFEVCNKDNKPSFAYPGLAWFVAFFLLGVISGIVGAVPYTNVLLPGAFLAVKGILFGWSVAQFSWSAADVRRLAAFGAVVGSLILLSCAINAALPTAWNNLFAAGGSPIQRYGLPSLLGPFIHPFDLAFATSMCAVAAIAYRQHIAKNRTSRFLILGGLFATILSFRRKDLIGLLVASVRFIFRFGYARMAVMAIPMIILTAILGWQEIRAQVEGLTSAYLTVSSEEARTVLTLGAITVATGVFPFGAGFGRFGSRTAAVEYSPEYHALGFPSVHGLGVGPTQGAFLTDTSWPAILGESGYLGAISFSVALLLMMRHGKRWERLGFSPEARWVGSTTVGWFILTIFQSLGSAVFTSPPMFAFLFGLVGIGTALERTERTTRIVNMNMSQAKRDRK